MNHKKILIPVLCLAAWCCFSFAASCYSDWLHSYESATATYTANQNECDGVLFGNDLCHYENELAYDNAIDNAGEIFHCCVLGC